jgi:Tfp pilus assembly protein PilX
VQPTFLTSLSLASQLKRFKKLCSSVSSQGHSAISGQPGQIAVVVLLVMAVLLVLGLSLAARTSQEIQLSGQEQDSTRVFNAAETGVEKALSDNQYFLDAESSGTGTSTVTLGTDELPDGINANVSITRQDGLTTYVNEGASATVQLEGSNAQNVVITWSKDSETCDSRASIIISLYYNDGTDKVRYYPLKPSCSGYNSNKAVGFSTVNVRDNVPGAYNHDYTLALAGIPNPKLARIKPLYAGTDISVTGVNLTQAFDIRSEAAETVGEGQSTVEKSAIQVTRTKPAPPTVLEYSLYSGGSLVKN